MMIPLQLSTPRFGSLFQVTAVEKDGEVSSDSPHQITAAVAVRDILRTPSFSPHYLDLRYPAGEFQGEFSKLDPDYQGSATPVEVFWTGVNNIFLATGKTLSPSWQALRQLSFNNRSDEKTHWNFQKMMIDEEQRIAENTPSIPFEIHGISKQLLDPLPPEASQPGRRDYFAVEYFLPTQVKTDQASAGVSFPKDISRSGHIISFSA